MKYEFAPLARAMGLTEHQAAARLGVSGSTQKEYRTVGMSELVADRMASKAGFHPAVIWPEWMDESVRLASKPCKGCTRPFIPAPGNQRYCCTPCRFASNQRKRRSSELVRKREARRMREYRAHAAAAAARRRKPRPCAAAGCECLFDPYPSTRLFCSQRCRAREMQRRYREAHREAIRARDRAAKQRARARMRIAA